MHLDASTSTGTRQSESSGGLPPRSAPGSNAQSGLLQRWYRIAAPVEPPDSTPQDRERVRYGQLCSIIILILFCFDVAELPNAFVSANHFFLFILLSGMTVEAGLFVLNRQGKVLVSGIIIAVVAEFAFMLLMLTYHTLSSGSLIILYMMVLTELIAVSVLPPRNVFLAALCNMVFTWAIISFMPRAASMNLHTPSDYYGTLASPLLLQIITALVTYLWAQGAREAIERAEQVAALEHALAERDREAAEQKQQLEQGIQQILQTHVQAANGNFDVRAPLARENVLWQVAYGLNNLLARLQRATQSENELQQTKGEAMRLAEAVRYAKTRRHLLQVPKSGTVLDPLAQELTGTYIDQR